MKWDDFKVDQSESALLNQQLSNVKFYYYSKLFPPVNKIPSEVYLSKEKSGLKMLVRLHIKIYF